MGVEGYFPKTLYLCDGGKYCGNSSFCKVKNPDITEGCSHTLNPRNARNGVCSNPEKFPERFFTERVNGDTIYYTEKEE